MNELLVGTLAIPSIILIGATKSYTYKKSNGEVLILSLLADIITNLTKSNTSTQIKSHIDSIICYLMIYSSVR